MDAPLRAGIAIYNVGHYHPAHDAWEDHWLDLPTDSGDERLLHGLIQFTAAIHHARERNWSGATGLAESAVEYLADLPADYRGVNVGAVRTSLCALRADPERIERAPPLRLTYEGNAIHPADLEFEAAAIVAAVFAEEGPYDEQVVDRAIEFAHDEVADGTETRFTSLVMDFAVDETQRALVYDRLRRHVDRRISKEEDVEGLFE